MMYSVGGSVGGAVVSVLVCKVKQKVLFVQSLYVMIFQLLTPVASAVQSDSVRRPIRFRPPPDQIPFAVQSDSVRRPIRFRPPSDAQLQQ